MELPQIPMEEYPQRLERLRNLMDEKALEAVLLTTGMNLAYFTGYPSPVRNVARPYFAILPLQGNPVFITHIGHLDEARRFCWFDDVRYYTKLSAVPLELLTEALSERLVRKGLGMELGFEQTLDISEHDFCEFKDAFGGTGIVDASHLLWRLRRIKSDSEIQCLRKACQITAESYAGAFLSLNPPFTEMQVFRAMESNLCARASGRRFLNVTSGKGNYDLVTKPPEDRLVKSGEIVWMDAGCTVSGYWSDFSRALVIGKPSAEQQLAQSLIHDITWGAVEQMKPGVKASSVARWCYSKLEELPFAITSSIAQRACRVGHGVGLNTTEPPHIGEHDDTVLEPGMVIALEPGVATEYGTFHVEENVLVTPDGFEVLSAAPRELWQVRLP